MSVTDIVYYHLVSYPNLNPHVPLLSIYFCSFCADIKFWFCIQKLAVHADVFCCGIGWQREGMFHVPWGKKNGGCVLQSCFCETTISAACSEYISTQLNRIAFCSDSQKDNKIIIKSHCINKPQNTGAGTHCELEQNLASVNIILKCLCCQHYPDECLSFCRQCRRTVPTWLNASSYDKEF